MLGKELALKVLLKFRLAYIFICLRKIVLSTRRGRLENIESFLHESVTRKTAVSTLVYGAKAVD